MTNNTLAEALEPDNLFQIARTCFHCAPSNTPDGSAFDRSERGLLLRKAVEKISATLRASTDAAAVAGHQDGCEHPKCPIRICDCPAPAEPVWLREAIKTLEVIRDTDAPASFLREAAATTLSTLTRTDEAQS